MPVDAVLAKDSFTITRRCEIFADSLFFMEKMPVGFDPENRDWRDTTILPDGSLFGATKREGVLRVAHFVSCHESVAETQH